MLSVSPYVKIYVYTCVVDMRKSINGLSTLLADAFEQDPQTGDVFVFVNRKQDKLKILFWDENGFVIYHKRLEKGKFQYSSLINDEKITVSPTQLSALLMGFDFYAMHENACEKYRDFF